MQSKPDRFNLLLVALALAATVLPAREVLADEQTLQSSGQAASGEQSPEEKPFKLKLRKDGKFETPGLERGKDLKKNKNGDSSFSSGEDVLEADPDAFKAKPVKKAPKIDGKIDGSGGGNLENQSPITSPTEGDGMNESPTGQQMPPQASNPEDPDENNPDMKLAWDMWHKRLAATIFDRFNHFAKAMFDKGPPMLAEVGYVVTRDGRVKDVMLRKPSQNGAFNQLAVQCVKSLDGNITVLQFPQGSRRMFVPKVGEFMKNYGLVAGYKYQKDDNEFIKGSSKKRKSKKR
jgi:hypothetical protein